MTMNLKVYAAGILNREGDWAWQGTVVAQSIAEGKKLLREWKIKEDIKGTPEVAALGEPRITTRPKGVSHSMSLE